MVALTALMAFSAILALTSADSGAGRKDKGHIKVTPNSTLRSRDLFRRQCEGTCEECFGSGYTLCPGSSYYCYLPGDSLYGLDSCSTDTSSAPEPTSTGSAGDSDFCSGASATCVGCFGEGYLDCPDNYHCYNPNDPEYDTCPDDSSSGGGSSTTSTCAEIYGAGSIDCGTDSCYNPTEGDVCCADGYHCEDGDTCSTEVGYCCTPGSSAPGCSGSDSDLTSVSSSSFTYSYTSPTSTSDSSDDFDFDSSSTDSSSSPDVTGVSQIDDSNAAKRGYEIHVTAFVLGMIGLGMLLL